MSRVMNLPHSQKGTPARCERYAQVHDECRSGADYSEAGIDGKNYRRSATSAGMNEMRTADLVGNY
jgi:hypothetical protein